MTTTLPSTRACSRKNRVYVFREFLLQTYGSYLSKDVIVLDVAGGKGDLSWLLQNVDGCRSIVVDPRPTQHQHILRSIQYLRQHPEEAALRAIRDRPTHQPLATLLPQLPTTNDFCSPRHFPVWVDEKLLQAVQAAQQGKQHQWEEYWTQATATSDTHDAERSQNPQKNDITDPKDAWEMIQKCKLIVAFHPDQATDFCFELAGLLDISFCIVPCCVFPALFPHRTLADGTRVRNYPGLLSYLTEKYPLVQKEQLAFHETATARNVALFTLPPSQQYRKRDRETHEGGPVSMMTLDYCEPTPET